MGRGRPPKPGTVEEKAAARRERVRNNVRALRERRKNEATHATPITHLNQLKIEFIDHEDAISSDEDESDLSSNLTSGSQKPSAASASSGTYMIDRRDNRKIGMLCTMNNRSVYATAFIGLMRATFLPDSVYLPPNMTNPTVRPWESKQFLWTPCAFWITSAFAKTSAQETSVLKTVVLAIGMAIKSYEVRDRSLQIAALEMYRRSLQGIRKALDPLITNRSSRPKDSISLYLSCHAAAMFELVLNSDLSATMHHLRGVSQLICHLGDDADEEGQSMAWLLLQDYRLAELGLCLKYRYISFSSIKRRHFENTVNNNTSFSNNIFVKVTDIGDEIAAVMVQLDIIKPKLQQPNAASKIRNCLSHLTSIWLKYEAIYHQVVQHCGASFVYRAKGSPDSREGELRFRSYDVGCAWCYNLMTQVHCLETSIDAVDMLLEIEGDASNYASPAESKVPSRSDESCEESIPDECASRHGLKQLRKMHRSVCIKLTHCIGYFLHTDKGVTGQALAIYPLDTAIDVLGREASRLKQDAIHCLGSSTSLEFTELQRDMQSIADAKALCDELREQAKSFGLPALEAGTTYLSSLQQDQAAFAAR